MDCSPPGSSVRGKNTGVGCHFLLQGIFPPRGSNWRCLHPLTWQVDSLPRAPLGKPLKPVYTQSEEKGEAGADRQPAPTITLLYSCFMHRKPPPAMFLSSSDAKDIVPRAFPQSAHRLSQPASIQLLTAGPACLPVPWRHC